MYLLFLLKRIYFISFRFVSFYKCWFHIYSIPMRVLFQGPASFLLLKRLHIFLYTWWPLIRFLNFILWLIINALTPRAQPLHLHFIQLYEWSTFLEIKFCIKLLYKTLTWVALKIEIPHEKLLVVVDSGY